MRPTWPCSCWKSVSYTHLENLALVGQQLADFVLLAELEVLRHVVGADRDIIVGLVIQEVIQAAVLVAVGHFLALDEGLGELGGGVVAGFDHGTGDDVLGLGAHERSALAGLDMLELHDLENLAVLFKGDAVTEFACRDHKWIPPITELKWMQIKQTC